MAINKVVFGNQTLIDISDATVTADKLLSGYTAYTKAGVKVTGTASAGLQVVTGSYTGTSSQKTITVTGLGFTPKGCLIAVQSVPGGNNSMISEGTVSVTTSSSGANVFGLRRRTTTEYTLITTEPTLQGGGFTYTASTGTFNGTYVYVVWG